MNSPPPHDHVYIYYLGGCLKKGTAYPNRHFLGDWQEEGTSFLFFSQPALDAVKALLQAQPQLTLIDKYHMTYDQWHGGQLKPYQVGRFKVTPAWYDVSPDPESIDIAMDPGVVFGTGTHATTRDCLKAIDILTRENTIASVLELGTGTGILALAAAKAGSQRTLAVDLNFLAAKTAAENVYRNGLDQSILVLQGQAEDWVDWPADLLIANIHFNVMRQLVESEGFYHKKWFILSGLMRSQANDIQNRLLQKPVNIIKKWAQDGIWYTFLGKTKGNLWKSNAGGQGVR